MFYFCDSNHREEFREQEIARKEQAKCSQVKSNLPNGGCVICSPAAREIVAVQRCNDDHKTFEPHTYIHNHRHKESNSNVSSHFPEPEYLRRQYVTAHHQPVTPSVWTERICTVFHKCPHF